VKDARVVLTTVGSKAEGEKLAGLLVEKRLVACATILPGALSIYRWKDVVEKAGECLIVMKTKSRAAPALEAEISRAHPYEVPEILSLPVSGGSPSYLAWLDSAVRGRRKPGTGRRGGPRRPRTRR
jgi:periplasmic divalent cation tolerance protein